MTPRDLKNRKVTVMGLGRLGGGVGVVKFLAKQGAKILVTDIKKGEELTYSLEMLKEYSNIEYVFGQHRKEDFIDRDFIIKNPGVPKNSPYLELARKQGIPVETDISLFFKLTSSSIIGVTGTKGKSTTASLIYQFLKGKYAAYLAGNIGVTPLSIVEKADTNSLVVLELSSWQLEDMKPFKISPHMAVVLNIYPDHLNRHTDFFDYIEAKKIIFRFGTKEDIAVLNYDDILVREFSAHVPGSFLFFSASEEVSGAFFKEGKLYWAGEEECIIEKENIGLRGEHNISNVLAAVTAAKIYKVKNKEISRVLKEFGGIPYRQEFIRNINGVEFYNDTAATIPEAAIAALNRFGKNSILIAGGVDKGLDYSNLAKEIAVHTKLLVLLPGSVSDKIKLKVNPPAGGEKLKVSMIEVSTMEEAVRKAFAKAKTGDIVILSPGAASFNLFKNEFDRGDEFNKVVKAL